MVDDVSQSHSHSISRPIRIEPFLRKASDWSASADLAARERAHTIQLATVTRPAIFLILSEGTRNMNLNKSFSKFSM